MFLHSRFAPRVGLQVRPLTVTPVAHWSNQKWLAHRIRRNTRYTPRTQTRFEWIRKDLARKIVKTLEFDETPTVSAFEKCDHNEPIDDKANPYQKARPMCVLCKYGIQLDYKNTRLLSQFISSFSGRMYEQHVTGLCLYQYEHLRVAIYESRRAGLMPVVSKNPRYLKDPRLFDPMRPIKPNSV